MAKFFGKVGYGIQAEVVLGVWEDSIIEKEYSGDILRNSRKLVTASGTLNDNIKVSNEISILADPFANANFNSIRFIEYMGIKWKVDSVEVQYPRLILSMGGVYNG
jgi:hypothetical protein